MAKTYFHGDNGAGLGASHQTGWTGTIALLMDLFGRLDASSWLASDRDHIQTRLVKEQVGGEALTDVELAQTVAGRRS